MRATRPFKKKSQAIIFDMILVRTTIVDDRFIPGIKGLAAEGDDFPDSTDSVSLGSMVPIGVQAKLGPPPLVP